MLLAEFLRKLDIRIREIKREREHAELRDSSALRSSQVIALAEVVHDLQRRVQTLEKALDERGVPDESVEAPPFEEITEGFEGLPRKPKPHPIKIIREHKAE